MATTLFIIIVSFILFDFILERVLEWLNTKNWSSVIPAQLTGIYDEEKYRTSQEYDKAKQRMSLVSSFISLILILLMLLLDGFAFLDNWLRASTEDPYFLALAFFGILFIASDLIGIPFSVYSVFVIEEKYGFNRTNIKTFIIDKLKGYLLTAVIGGAILSLIVWFFLSAGIWFWLYAWIAMTVITLIFTIFYTDLIVPLFNKLEPLPDGELRTAIQGYTQGVKFPLKNIFVMNGSKRSTKANAYFSGLGSKKSIVLFDTLIEDHTVDELVAVLAHEVGHYKKKHVQQGMIISGIQMGIMLFVLGWLVNSPTLSAALGAEPSFHIGLLAFTLLYSPINMATGILTNMISRKNEFEADNFALNTYNGKALMEALKKLSVKHLSNLNPHPAFVFFYYSHPPLLDRLRELSTENK
ncbi:MAG: M48 family metallopeptidase [Bacteroidetes bacterium]|nr:M48 family metallopeptidase [Bacteroidota bacterium]